MHCRSRLAKDILVFPVRSLVTPLSPPAHLLKRLSPRRQGSAKVGTRRRQGVTSGTKGVTRGCQRVDTGVTRGVRKGGYVGVSMGCQLFVRGLRAWALARVGAGAYLGVDVIVGMACGLRRGRRRAREGVDAAVGAGAGVRVGMGGGRCRCRTWAWMLGRARPQTPALASVSWVYLPFPPVVTPYQPANLCRQGDKGCQGGNNEAPMGDQRGQGGDQGVPGS